MRRSIRRGAAAALVALRMAVPFPPAQEVSLDALVSLSKSTTLSNVPLTRVPSGIEIDVDGRAFLLLPFPGAVEIELECVSDGMLNVYRASESGMGEPPFRYSAIPRGTARLRFDLLESDKWTYRSRPVLLFDGSTRLSITGIHVRPPPRDPELLRTAIDRAAFWAPESIGHTTINFLTPTLWSVMDGIFLADVVAGSAVVVFAVALAGIRIARRRWNPGIALSIAALAAVAAQDAHFLVRLVPAVNLSLPADPEVRIRDNYYFAPEMGALASLARATIRHDETVGVVGAPDDWFAPQAMCFNLAPRQCGIVKPGETSYAGISGIGRLRLDEMDAIVYIGGRDPLPPGFGPVAGVGRRAFIARRQ